MKISIIVPVYNVKDFLVRCLDSLLAQTFTDLEILLIDDGSTDGSGKLCDEYSLKYSQMKTIHQKNSGLSAARNTGIKAAKGKYILFVDSDDYIAKDSCEKLYALAEKYDCDIVRGNAYNILGNTQKTYANIPVFKTPVLGVEFTEKALLKKSMAMCAPFALYKKELIISNNLYFYPSLLHEDEFWTPQIYLHAKRVCSINYHFYYHWHRTDSITTSAWSEKKYKDLLFICEQLYPIFNRQNSLCRKLLLDHLCMIYLHATNQSQNKRADRYFPLKTAYSVKNRIKSILFFISPRLYFKINSTYKRFEKE